MNSAVALIGDIHGNLSALQGLWKTLLRRKVLHSIFLGDYINKGTRSAGVLQQVISYADAGHATLLAGNHETALLSALDRGDLSEFLKMGGAATVRSYVQGRVGPDVLHDFTAKFPHEHLEAIRRMPQSYETDDLIAQHTPPRVPNSKYCVSAHTPVGNLPRIGQRSAQLDTGCGEPSGRLTALLWPTLVYLQVDIDGFPIND